jgi:RNA polymerase sigma-70 factor, ECF subfamily
MNTTAPYSEGNPGLRAGFQALLGQRAARDRLVRVAARVLPGADAEDAVHDGIVQALTSASAFRGESQLSTWMHQVTVNAALMRLRRVNAQARRCDEAERAAAVAPWVLASQLPGPAEAVERRHTSELCARALAALAPPYRIAVEQCLLQERPIDDVAAELGITPSALRTRVVRGRRMLIDALAPS